MIFKGAAGDGRVVQFSLQPFVSNVSLLLLTILNFLILLCVVLTVPEQVSCYEDSQRITIHSYAFVRTRWVPETFGRARRCRTDLHFTASTVEEALGWVAAFAQQGCYIQFLPHPNSSKKGSASTETTTPSAAKEAVKCRASREMLVVLNPKSGRGRARKVFRSKVQPILEVYMVLLSCSPVDFVRGN